jgi:alpha-glucosidase
MCWDERLPHGGFSFGDPWLPVATSKEGSVARQAEDRDSMMSLYRDLIAVRTGFSPGTELRFHEVDGVLVFERDPGFLVVANMSDRRLPVPATGAVLRATHASRYPAGSRAPSYLKPGEGFVATA